MEMKIDFVQVKTYRLWKIFTMSKRVVKHYLKDQYLLLILCGFIVVLSCLLIGLCVGDPYYLDRLSYDSENDYEYCTSKHQMHVYVPVILSIRFTLLFFTAICAYQIRKIPDIFNETRQLVFTIYNLLFLSISLPTIDLTLGRGKDIPMIIYGLCTFLICILTTLIMFLPKLILVISMDDKKERSKSSTFLFAETILSSTINKDSIVESPVKNLSILRRTKTDSNEKAFRRSYSLPLC